jgi:multimeric flavodoxin WrbA
MMSGTLCTFNGSPHPDGHTAKAIAAVTRHLWEVYDLDCSTLIDIPVNLQGCLGCENCGRDKRCAVDDFTDSTMLFVNVRVANVILIATPVYLDMPTAQTVAFLTRLNRFAETTRSREMFKDKDVHLLAVSYCSGTKSAIHTMMGACEMLGFNIPGRCTWEHSLIWNDNKVRGGHGASVYITE